MRNICIRCKSTSRDGNLWCQEIECPAGTLPLLLQYGDYLGDIKVLSLVCVLRTAVIYKAEQNGKTYLLKVANPGLVNETLLKQEAEILRALGKRMKAQRKRNVTGLPEWVMPNALSGKKASGIVPFRGQMRVFMLMQAPDGDLLSNFLLDNPQPWQQHIAWFIMSIAEAIREIQTEFKAEEVKDFEDPELKQRALAGLLHLNLQPDSILVWRNSAGVPQPTLLHLGLLRNHGESLSEAMRKQALSLIGATGYVPPRLISGHALVRGDDVFGLGVILYEMLTGHPAFTEALRQDEAIRTALLEARYDPVNRTDLATIMHKDGKSQTPKLLIILQAALVKPSENREITRAAATRPMCASALVKPSENREITVSQVRKDLEIVYKRTPIRRVIPWQRIGEYAAILIIAVALASFGVLLLLELSSPLSLVATPVP